MSRTTYQDLEEVNNPDGHHGYPQSTPSQPSQVESRFGDSSGPLFSIYSKAAEDEDNKMVERWQKDADGILIFTGLFSAAVAALLSMTIGDLRPNSQDTSAFYLGNIFQVLADPNATRASIPSPSAKPPPFSPPRYAIWVNSLWFLSLVMGLSCALWATSLHQWARRYIRMTQPARCSPEKRARMRAYFANGVDKMHIPWAVEGLPTLLHLSLFLFFGGLVIFLFNIDHEVFTCVVWWIVLFSTVYGLITVLPLIRQDSPYYAPLSTPVWSIYASIQYVTFKLLTITLYSDTTYLRRLRFSGLNRYRGWILGGMEKAVDETVSEKASDIDVQILSWTIGALGDDDSLEKFFEAIPGFFDSKLVVDLERGISPTFLRTFWRTLDGFMGRTSSSNSVMESVKSRRVIICRDIMDRIPCPCFYGYQKLRPHFNQAPVTIEKLEVMARWFTNEPFIRDVTDVNYAARRSVALNLPRIKEIGVRWITLAHFSHPVYGLSKRELRNYVALGRNNVLLAILINVSRQAIHTREWEYLEPLSEFDIRDTLPGLQHDFCTLWNELVQEAWNLGPYSTPVRVLYLIRHLYNSLHQGIDADTIAFTGVSTDSVDLILFQPSSYQLCNISNHRPDSTLLLPVLTQPGDSPDASPHHSTLDRSTVSIQFEKTNIVAGPSLMFNPTTPSEIEDPQAPAATSSTLPALTNPRHANAPLPGAVVTAPQDIFLATTMFHPPEGTARLDIVESCAKPDFTEVLSAVSIAEPSPTLASVPASTPPVLNRSSASRDKGVAFVFNPLLPASPIVNFSIPASSPPSGVTPLLDTEFLTLLSSTTPSRPTGNDPMPRLRARGLVNTGSMCSANAVLQLLVHSPPFWNMLKELGDLKVHRREGGPEIDGRATPVLDATVKFFGEFVLRKEPPPAQQPPQQAASRKPKEDEEAKNVQNVVDSFEPSYMYDAMKGKRQLKGFLDGQQQDAEEFFRLFLETLDEELLALLTSIGGLKSIATPSGVLEEHVVSPSSCLTEVGKQEFTAESAKSPLMRIFGGKYRLTVRAPNQPDIVTIEDWRSLQLDILHDSVHIIEDALARISHTQPVQLGPSGISEASQQVLIEVLPPVLVLHLKRFLYDVAADGIVKISKPVKFGPELRIPPEIMAPVVGKSAEPVNYKLYGVLYHHGTSAGSGHYTVNVLHPNEDSGGEAWLHIDDEVVSTVRHEEVFRGHDSEEVEDQCAYMLFYCRTAPT